MISPVSVSALQSRCHSVSWHVERTVCGVYCFTDVRNQGLWLWAGTWPDIMRPLLDKLFCVPASATPVPCSRARVHPWRSHHATTPCQTWWPDVLHWSISSAMNTLQCIIWRSNHQMWNGDLVTLWTSLTVNWTVVTSISAILGMLSRRTVSQQ